MSDQTLLFILWGLGYSVMLFALGVYVWLWWSGRK